MVRDETFMCAIFSGLLSELTACYKTKDATHTVYLQPCLQTRPQIINVLLVNRAGNWTKHELMPAAE